VGINTHEIAFIPGSDTVRVKFSNVNIVSEVEGSIYALWFIPLHASWMNITNCTMQLDLGFVRNQDNVHWQLQEANFIDI
jgi:hypothetical protein